MIDRIGSEIRCFNIETGWDGVDTYDYTQIDKSVETLLKGYPMGHKSINVIRQRVNVFNALVEKINRLNSGAAQKRQ